MTSSDVKDNAEFPGYVARQLSGVPGVLAFALGGVTNTLAVAKNGG
jgi:hypothetical protein